MPTPPLDPLLNDRAPIDVDLTPYDRAHLITYLRMLDAASEGADWREVARLVLQIEPDTEPDRAYRAWESHLARARWMLDHGYRHLLDHHKANETNDANVK